MISRAATATLLLAIAAMPAHGQKIRTERIHFKPGATSATIEGRLQGSETVDYIIGARKGQSANVSLATKHGATYFNIMAPGQKEEAFFIGSTSGNQYEGTLPASGDFTIRVYMMRSAARRNETSNYRLEVAITGAGEQTAHMTHDAKVPGTDFHATGPIPCSMGSGQPMRTCEMGVKRTGGGSGTVTVTRPDGRKRNIFFEKGTAIGYDESQADPAPFKAMRESDMTIVHIGAERYEIIDAVVFGG